ncbi:MAG: transcription antitermination factor NusB [Simkaniaceae bacterium]|nr:transcription antitermination factor NusB [Simkaniaceae bacterium]
MDTLPRPKFREVLFLLLYSYEFTHESDSKLFQFVSEQLKVAMRHIRSAAEDALAIQAKCAEIDLMIEEVSSEYKIERIPKVELTILRLALYEMFFDDAIPGNVAIAEGIRLSKKFGTGECFKFVNAILDAVKNKGHFDSVAIESNQVTPIHGN